MLLEIPHLVLSESAQIVTLEVRGECGRTSEEGRAAQLRRRAARRGHGSTATGLQQNAAATCAFSPRAKRLQNTSAPRSRLAGCFARAFFLFGSILQGVEEASPAPGGLQQRKNSLLITFWLENVSRKRKKKKIWQNGVHFWTNSIRRNRCVSVLLMNLYSSMKTHGEGS